MCAGACGATPGISNAASPCCTPAPAPPVAASVAVTATVPPIPPAADLGASVASTLTASTWSSRASSRALGGRWQQLLFRKKEASAGSQQCTRCACSITKLAPDSVSRFHSKLEPLLLDVDAPPLACLVSEALGGIMTVSIQLAPRLPPASLPASLPAAAKRVDWVIHQKLGSQS
eukprot:1588977-Prymnesium_polylepis.1